MTDPQFVEADARPFATDQTSVSVVIPHYNDLEALSVCIGGLQRQTWPADRMEVIVADNNSRCGIDAVVAAAPGCRVVHAPIQGAGPARNAGAAAARGEILAFIDSDCSPEPGWIEHGVRALSKYHFAGGHVGARVGVDDADGHARRRNALRAPSRQRQHVGLAKRLRRGRRLPRRGGGGHGMVVSGKGGRFSARLRAGGGRQPSGSTGLVGASQALAAGHRRALSADAGEVVRIAAVGRMDRRHAAVDWTAFAQGATLRAPVQSSGEGVGDHCPRCSSAVAHVLHDEIDDDAAKA